MRNRSRAAASPSVPDSRFFVHSDRSVHYRWLGRTLRIEGAKLIRSMSRKGRSPDNAVCKGFFDRLKTKSLYSRVSKIATIEQFVEVSDSYTRWYNEKRIKIPLGSLSPIDYRKSLGLATQNQSNFLFASSDVGIQNLRELFDGRRPPVTNVERLGLEPAEETLIGCIVWRVALA